MTFTKEMAREMLAKVRANHARLDGCTRHVFEPTGDPALVLARRYRCISCEGEVDSTAYFWYAKGLKHGGEV